MTRALKSVPPAHCRSAFGLRGLLLLSACGATAVVNMAVAVTRADYSSAERFLPWNTDKYLVNADIQHHWIGKQDRFWYLRTSASDAREFVVVDAATGKTQPAFDHQKIAGGLARATQTAVEPGALPFTEFRYTLAQDAIQFRITGQTEKLWTCQLKTGACSDSTPVERPGESKSPDGKWLVAVRDHNLWIRPAGGGSEVALTTDGVEYNGYSATRGDSGHVVSDQRFGVISPAHVAWSPDSKYLLTYRVDETKIKESYLIQSTPEDGTLRPKLYTFRWPMPGDSNIPALQPVIIDVGTHQLTRFDNMQVNAPFEGALERHYLWWSADGSKAYFIQRERFSRSVSLMVLDPKTGTMHSLVEESSPTWVRLNGDDGIWTDPSVRTCRNGDVIWWSERDGWGHLYYYDGATGRLRNQITKGPWVVRNIVRIDDAQGRVFFTASGREPGREPYKLHLYSVKFDGSGIRLLTPEDAEHARTQSLLEEISHAGLSSKEETERFSASGRYFVDSYSGVNLPPVLAVRSADGRLIKNLERADISRLAKGGLTSVEAFKVLAADGRSEIYGNLFRPSKFDPAKRYPLIDSIYPGPQITRTNRAFTAALFDELDTQSLAELGFVVITIDGRGTPHRSHEFSDYSYGRLDKASDLDDHIAGIRQLAQRYPYIDLDRVGIWGASGGGYASAHAMLSHPEFYKVAVSAEGNQDQRGYAAHWGETYIGPDNPGNYLLGANAPLAAHLKGKLLVMQGELDDNVSPSLALQLISALIRENKDFDYLLMPNRTHAADASPYFTRRRWDYFVRNLLGEEPPAGYVINLPPALANQHLQ